MKISSIYIERAYSFNEMQTLGDKIKKLIKAQGWGIQEFSLHIGYEKTRVSKVLGAEPINAEAIERIAKGLGVTPEYLAGLGDLKSGGWLGPVVEPDAPRLKPEDALAKAEEALVKADEEIRRLREQVDQMGKTNQRLLDLLEKSMTR